MAFVVVYDTCVLYGNTVRNLLIRVARSRLVQAKWTNQILDEQIVDERTNPPETFDQVLGQLERGGLIESAAQLRLG